MDARDLDVRRFVYFTVAATGRPPNVADVSDAFGIGTGDAAASFRRLHEAHALVLSPESTDIWMANPFCFAPTPHSVFAAGRTWTGTCAWDSLGIPGALHGDGRVSSECACCGEPLELEVEDGVLVRGGEVLAHFVVPARSWWEDIGFT